MTTPEEILGFWLDEVGPAGWYSENPVLDATIRERFGAAWEQARAGMLKIARNPEALTGGKIGEALRQLGETLQDDPALGRTINRFARRAAVGATPASVGGAVSPAP